MLSRRLVQISCSLLVVSCAFTPHEVTVVAEAPITPSSIGKGVTVALEVFDDRDDTTVGQRGVGMQGADITVNDIIPLLERELKEGLEAKGFAIVPGGTSGYSESSMIEPGAPDVELEAKLRAFKFFIETGFWTGAENTNVVIHVEAIKRGRDYEKSYRSNSEELALVIPEGAAIDENLNAALSDVLAQIMQDEQLMDFLAK